jgi:tetratricopeptide (TPR) repeat protein
MSRTMLGVCAAFLLIVVPATVTGRGRHVDSAEPAPETKDRLSGDRMSRLVARPISTVERRGLAEGKAAFDRLLAQIRARHGHGSVQVADLLVAFGVRLYTLGQATDDRRLREEALPYLEAAIPAYRAAFGATHPEVAVALNTYADALRALHEDNPPESAETALAEAYRIRLAALGPNNPETLATLRYLAGVRGHPSRTRGDPARIEAAAALFRELIAHSPNDRRRDSAPYVHTAFARMYAQNGMAAQARDQLRLAAERTRNWDAPDRCLFAALEISRVEDILADRTGGPREHLMRGSGGVAECLTL